jgi:5-methylcytosine-specific restriction endonuclease McrA
MYYKGHCHYCGKKVTHDKMTIDHVIPKSKGGKTEEKNCVPSCYDCNQLKRTSNYGDFKAGLIMAGSCGTM